MAFLNSRIRLLYHLVSTCSSKDYLILISFQHTTYSTINPILYNVMSRRYRVAFKEILCGKKAGAYYNNGFAREQSSFIKAQSSFRHSSIASTNQGGNLQYSRVHSVSWQRYFNQICDCNSFLCFAEWNVGLSHGKYDEYCHCPGQQVKWLSKRNSW